MTKYRALLVAQIVNYLLSPGMDSKNTWGGSASFDDICRDNSFKIIVSYLAVKLRFNSKEKLGLIQKPRRGYSSILAKAGR